MIHLCPDELLPLAVAAPYLRGWAIRLLAYRQAWAVLWCGHREMLHSRRDDGHLDVVCARCGYRTHLLEAVRDGR